MDTCLSVETFKPIEIESLVNCIKWCEFRKQYAYGQIYYDKSNNK